MQPDDTDPTPNAVPVVSGLEIIELVARGGHGRVFLARQEAHDRLVALKVLDARFADEATRRRFDRERTALGRLSDHPSIVSLLDSGFTEDGAPYLVLEYAPGGSLADRIEAGPMGVAEATSIVIDLAAAIEETHSAGVVHRDIKPANILRSAYGDWMLGDFGIATIVDRSATSAIHVSYAHTAPETFDGDGSTPAADVYSLASVLATCLTGDEPFEMAPDEAPLAVMQRVLTQPYPDLRRAGVPDDLAVLLEMALSKDPSQRPVSARAFARALNDLRLAHGLPERSIRAGVDVGESGSAEGGQTVAVDPAQLPPAAPSWSNQPASDGAEPSPRRGRILAFAAAFLLTIFALSFVVPTLMGGTAGAEDVVAEVFDVVEVVFDGDGPGNDGNGNGNGGGNGGNGNGNGGGGNGGGNGGGGNGRGGGNGGGGNG
jgi:serine/threonine protein kinase